MLAIEKHQSATVRDVVGRYLKTFPQERCKLEQLTHLLTFNHDLLDRERAEHVVVGDLIIHPDEGRVLLELYQDENGQTRMVIPHFHVDPYHADWARLFHGVSEGEKLQRTADFETIWSVAHLAGQPRKEVFGNGHYLFDIRQAVATGDEHRAGVHTHWEVTFVRQAKCEFEVQHAPRGEYVWASINKLCNSDRPESIRLGAKLKKLGLDKKGQIKELK